MRALVLFLLIFSLSFITNAQSFLPATLVTRQSDTLSGYVRVDYNPLLIRFKSDLTSQPINYTVSSIKALTVENMVYEPKVVEGEMILMQKLLSGAASLFAVRQKPFRQNRYFLEKGTAFVELVRKSSETVVNGKLYVETYQNHLAIFSKLLNDCNDFNNQSWPTSFDENSLVALVSAYNRCTENSTNPTLKSTVYQASKMFPTRWFISVGGGRLGSPTSNIASSLKHYTYQTSDVLAGAYIRLEDQSSRVLTNNFFTASVGFERSQYGRKNSWGGMISYSGIAYKHSIDTRGFVNYYPNDYIYRDRSGNLPYLPPPLNQQPMRFEGTCQEISSIIQANVFFRRYWTHDKTKIYLGPSAGLGLVSSAFQAPVRVYLADGSYQGMAERDLESVTTVRYGPDLSMEAGWLYLLSNNGQSVGFSIQYHSLQANRISLSLTYAL